MNKSDQELIRLRATVATLEQLLDVQEQCVAEQSVHMEDLIRRLTRQRDELERTNASLLKEVSDRKRAEAKFRVLLELAPDAIIIVNAEGRMVLVNAQTEHLFGYNREELMGYPVEMLVPERFRRSHADRRSHYFRSPIPRAMGSGLELFGRRRDGIEFPVAISLSPLETEDGTFIMSVIRDITERKRAQTALEQAKEVAEAANRAKTEFLASMSHEIRTPMNAIIGMADLLEESSVTDEQRQYVQVVKQAGETLLALLNDILDLSKIEAGHVEIERVPFDLDNLIETTGDLMAVRAHTKHLELTCHVDVDLPAGLIGDPTRLRQILINLLSNAVKFTEQGEVNLQVTRALEGQKPGALRFSVKDSGVGIPSDKLEMIFERFTQVDASTTRKYGGTGLGLNISKRLADLMGGRLWVESTIGQGSAFHLDIQFDFQPVPTSAPARHPPLSLDGQRVLIIDDNATNRFILKRMMAETGAIFGESSSGQEGVDEFAWANEAGRPYSIVLLDNRMPRMDGFEVAQILRALPGVPDLLVLMLTSDNRRGDLSRCRTLGIAQYLIKPVKRTDLLRALSEGLGARLSPLSATAHDEPAEENTSTRPLRILLVDDSPSNRILLQAYLKHTPHHVEVAEDGAVAVEKLQSTAYDIVFMDMQMPVMDGYAATMAIRQRERDEGLPPVPVIALTAAAFKEDRERCLKAGCTAYIPKPVKKAAVLTAIDTYVP